MEEEEADRHEKGGKVKKRLTLRPSEFRALLIYFLFYVYNAWLFLTVVILFCFYSIGFWLCIFLSVCLAFDAL